MAHFPTIPVPQSELDALFEALDFWSKINGGRLTCEFIPKKRLPSWDYPGGVSDILRHRNSAGYQVATTHRITAADGSVPDWHAKDIHIGDIVIYLRRA
jgi:hypothetical protein